MSEMDKKYTYNKDISSDLRDKIEDAERRVHYIQAQAFIYKQNAQYKKEARVEEMIDACSYKLWTKEKLEEEELI